MRTQLFLALVTVSARLMTSFKIDYCSLSCDGVRHTMCEYEDGGGSGCADYRRGLTKEEETMIVDLHNELRQRVATGVESRGHQPPGSNMLEVFWSQEAAAVAQRWADQCEARGHDHCRRTSGEVHVGQNVAWTMGYDHSGMLKSRREAISTFINGWYDEVVNSKSEEVDDFSPDQDTPQTGHYTQLVWAESAELGCGFVEFTSDTEYEYKLVCNYVPAGNFWNLQIYKRGDPCSECPAKSKCSDKWPGLCDWTKRQEDKNTFFKDYFEGEEEEVVLQCSSKSPELCVWTASHDSIDVEPKEDCQIVKGVSCTVKGLSLGELLLVVVLVSLVNYFVISLYSCYI